MAKSMTAFGRSTLRSKAGLFSIELSSLNKKALEMVIHAPREFAPYDLEVRKWIGEKVHRGQIALRIVRDGEHEHTSGLEALKELKKYWETIARDLGLNETPSLAFLASQAAQMNKEAVKSSIGEKDFFDALDEALEELLRMKALEGRRLAADLEKRLDEIAHLVDHVEQEASKGPEHYRERLHKKLQELGIHADERIAVEVVLFADRIDVSEEITRLRSHIEQMRTSLASDQSIGRGLEFLAQEMQREVNTIGAKALEMGVKKSALTLRGIIEQIREQVQNIE